LIGVGPRLQGRTANRALGHSDDLQRQNGGYKVGGVVTIGRNVMARTAHATGVWRWQMDSLSSAPKRMAGGAWARTANGRR
jgi:hypothetical protein